MYATDYSYDQKFERVVIGMGLKYGMFAFNDNGYISPITRELYAHYKENTLNARIVNELIQSLKYHLTCACNRPMILYMQ